MPGWKLSTEYVRRLNRALAWVERQMQGRPTTRRRASQVVLTQWRFAQLTADLVPFYGNTTARIYKDDNIEDWTEVMVYSPPYQDTTISAGIWVKIEKLNGKWFVTVAGCEPPEEEE